MSVNFKYHRNLTNADLHVPGYIQATDPGAVGAGRVWVDTSGGTGNWEFKLRNATDTGWESVSPSLVEQDPVFTAWLALNPTSGTNTGDQDLSGLVPKYDLAGTPALSIDSNNRQLCDINGGSVVSWGNSIYALFASVTGARTVYLDDGVNALYASDGPNIVSFCDGANACTFQNSGLGYVGAFASATGAGLFQDTTNSATFCNGIYAGIFDGPVQFKFPLKDSDDNIFAYPFVRQLIANDGSTIMLDWSTVGTVSLDSNNLSTYGEVYAENGLKTGVDANLQITHDGLIGKIRTVDMYDVSTDLEIDCGTGSIKTANDIETTGSISASNLSGNNTGDQDLIPYATKSFAIAMAVAL